jgi:transcription-repair coupling factor (superfamily II helicase)
MDNLINPLLELDEYRQALNSAREYKRPVNIVGPSESQKAHFCHAILSHTGCKGMYVAYNEMQARRFYEDFAYFMGEDVLFFPTKEIMLYDVEAKSNDAVYQRLSVINKLIEGNFRLVVTSIEAVSHKLLKPEAFERCIIKIENGGRIDLGSFSEKLVMMAYERVESVERHGQFAIRGGIADVFPIDSDNPVRIELFDDEVDSIRFFNAETQRSIESVDNICILPAREIIYPPEIKKDIIKDINNELSRVSKKNQSLAAKVKADMDRFREEYYFPGIDRYTAYIANDPSFIFDYIQNDVLVFMDEPSRQKQRLDNLLLEHDEICKGLIEKSVLMPQNRSIFYDFSNIYQRLKSNKLIYLNTINADTIAANEAVMINIPSRLEGSYQGDMDFLINSLLRWKKDRNRVVVLSGTRGRGERLRETLSTKGVEAVYFDDIFEPVQRGQVVITRGSLNRGFEYPGIGFVIVSDKQVFGQARKPSKTSGRRKGRPISAFSELNIGDYVVHQAHGIGQYVGIEQLSVDGAKRDYLKIRYQENAFLYIPTNQMDLIQKYIGPEGRQPKVNKLGGTDWLKTKNKVKASLKELAEELIKLYAKRRASVGYAFSKDTVWQKQFEEQFPYEETDDQLKCIQEIKEDMESGRIMDRLLCGDVGYGKTEVAIRAIFKAAMDAKQVAYLVPTTVLAQQQYESFKERLKDFPVTVEVISRFRTPSEQKRILKDVKAGNVDILIGTHRLLQKDIQYKDLGLLVVDEEQRFGVSHKEKIKNLKPGIDVLTMTATPIPRTLHMSLVGIRDISLIEDPPEERYPVQTYVMEYNKDVIKDAIIREIGRHGQVFYLYNRVRSIDVRAAEIQALVPEARVIVAHGQMDEKQLEDVMFSFIKGEYDVLVCTTIIETGIDMPNVNTMIVEDADRMGLAQLYQLRGRVGRSNRLAYAYITYKKDKVISEVAEKRLQAIKEFTELGSGFKIAMRDMEIRGAGNLLGPEQHGHMEAVGYDMYCRLLDEAVSELKGEKPHKDEVEITIDINVSAYIDDSYISSEGKKIEMYKKIASISDEQDVLDVQDELTDRYGDIPVPVQNLIKIASIKSLAASLGFTAISERDGAVMLQLSDAKGFDFKALGKAAEKYKRQLLFNAGVNPYLLYRPATIQRSKLLDNIKILLQDLKSYEER